MNIQIYAINAKSFYETISSFKQSSLIVQKPKNVK